MTAQQPPQIRLGLIERAVSVFSPGLALKRYSSRVALEIKRRHYDAAEGGRLTAGWKTGKLSADSEIAGAGSLLRDRSRDLVRNNPLAAQAVQVLVNNLTGPGIRPRAKSGSKTRDRRINRLFDLWSHAADRHGHTDFYGLQTLAVREMIEGGDLFALRRVMPKAQRKPGLVPLQIELMEADHLDESRVSVSGSDGARIRQGIEYRTDGARTGYWLWPEHPGDGLPSLRGIRQSLRVPAAQVAHLFERQRIQSRGVPWAAPAMMALRDHGDWQIAELVRKKTEACLTGVVLGEDDGGEPGLTATVQDAEGNAVEQFRPGMIAYAHGGRDIKFNQPAHAGGVAEWNRVQMHLIAAGFRVPYALMTGDLSQANFSSNRAGLNEFRRMIDQMQWQIVIPMLCQRIWDWFTEAAYLAGLTDTPKIAVEWAPPKFESVNPKQDAETDLLEVRAGFASRSQMIAKRGYDPREIEAEAAEDNAEADRLGLIFDSDPRHRTRSGNAQAGDNPPDTGDSEGASAPE